MLEELVSLYPELSSFQLSVLNKINTVNDDLKSKEVYPITFEHKYENEILLLYRYNLQGITNLEIKNNEIIIYSYKSHNYSLANFKNEYYSIDDESFDMMIRCFLINAVIRNKKK